MNSHVELCFLLDGTLEGDQFLLEDVVLLATREHVLTLMYQAVNLDPFAFGKIGCSVEHV